MRFAKILIQHAYSRKQESFTYAIPEELDLKKGDGVVVPFQRTEKAGLVLEVHEDTPEFKTKTLVGKLGEAPLLEEWQIELADWISEYYFCSKYDALKLFLPKQIFKVNKRKPKPLNRKNVQTTPPERPLTETQKNIVDEILSKRPPISLIHGITGAGKTEIYTQLIKNCIQNGEQALVLAPEIALTPQLLKTFEVHFPRIAVIHSRVTEAERAKLWRAIQNKEVDLILGSRSALFSPFKNLGLIVMDEEHEASYKQDQNPRYHARTVALKMADLKKIPLVLGSATPSIESMWHAQEGHYALFTLTERISGTALPKVEVADLRIELKKGNFSPFSEILEQKIRLSLAAHEQVILFLNRRGSASSTVCRDCGYTVQCSDCELPLTYHAKNFHQPLLICHHCGRLDQVPTLCPHCHGNRIRHLGTGTEKIDTELQKLFPTARIARADKDTMSKKNSHSELYDKLQAGEIDILIGTQMIGKGFDIAKVNLVGILLADLGLNIPDFRTTERMFQLLTQVAGRAGRREKQGEVVLQTYNPDHPAIVFSKTHDYKSFYEQEISSRRAAQFPPFKQIIKLMCFAKTEKEAQRHAQNIKTALLDSKDIHVDAAPALMNKLKNQYQWNVLITGEHPRTALQKLPHELLENCRIDVDPLLCV